MQFSIEIRVNRSGIKDNAIVKFENAIDLAQFTDCIFSRFPEVRIVFDPSEWAHMGHDVYIIRKGDSVEPVYAGIDSCIDYSVDIDTNEDMLISSYITITAEVRNLYMSIPMGWKEDEVRNFIELLFKKLQN